MSFGPQDDSFATTRWSIVKAAGEHASPEGRAALELLCATYWYPLYAYLRKRGHSAGEAQDLTQAFFAEMLEKGRLEAADQERGRFRTFLLASLRNFVRNQWRHAHAQKRGGQRSRLALDFDDGERRYSHEPIDQWTPERIYEWRWAMTLVERALQRVEQEYDACDKRQLFDALKAYLVGDPEAGAYRTLGARLGMSEGAVKVAAHRLRARCRELLRDEIAGTVADPREIDDELQYLLTALQA